MLTRNPTVHSNNYVSKISIRGRTGYPCGSHSDLRWHIFDAFNPTRYLRISSRGDQLIPTVVRTFSSTTYLREYSEGFLLCDKCEPRQQVSHTIAHSPIPLSKMQMSILYSLSSDRTSKLSRKAALGRDSEFPRNVPNACGSLFCG